MVHSNNMGLIFYKLASYVRMLFQSSVPCFLIFVAVINPYTPFKFKCILILLIINIAEFIFVNYLIILLLALQYNSIIIDFA